MRLFLPHNSLWDRNECYMNNLSKTNVSCRESCFQPFTVGQNSESIREHQVDPKDLIPYQANVFYVVDRGCNDFKSLFNIKDI